MCYFQQSNGSQKGYLGFVRGDGWRGFEGFSFSWLNTDWIIHGHPTDSWAACETHFTRLCCLTAAMPSFHLQQNQSRWLLLLQNRHMVWWGKLYWLCFNQGWMGNPKHWSVFYGSLGGGKEKEQSPIGNVVQPVFLTPEEILSVHKGNGSGSSKMNEKNPYMLLENHLEKAHRSPVCSVWFFFFLFFFLKGQQITLYISKNHKTLKIAHRWFFKVDRIQPENLAWSKYS